jgi:crossover junction endodeoxyribonuclease RuvC
MGKKSSRALWAEHLKGGGQGPHRKTDSARASGLLREPFQGVVLGIDPSLRGTGLALVSFGSEEDPELLQATTVRNRPETPFADCLAAIFRSVEDYLALVEVRHVAVEQTIFVQNNQTAQILGAARGAAMTAPALRGLPLFEYSPRRIKQAVSGYGQASKEQVGGLLKTLFSLSDPLGPDEADAAATAICHAYTWQPLDTGPLSSVS